MFFVAYHERMETLSARFKIRSACLEDAPAIAKTYALAKRLSLPDLLTDLDGDSDFQSNRWRDYMAHGSRAQFATGDSYVSVAEVEDQMVGYVAWHSTTRHGAESELQSLYVLREFQNLGVGGALLCHAAEQALSRGIQSMCVGYDPSNPYKRFYSKNGAQPLNEHWSLWVDLATVLALRDTSGNQD
jgi:GNAT superfamily N-acetyltransferase